MRAEGTSSVRSVGVSGGGLVVWSRPKELGPHHMPEWGRDVTAKKVCI